jgi:hypothetical protein
MLPSVSEVLPEATLFVPWAELKNVVTLALANSAQKAEAARTAARIGRFMGVFDCRGFRVKGFSGL